jgi:hypothetical protein
MKRMEMLRVVALCLRRPRLLPLLAGAAWRFRRSGWYRRPPFLPLPSADYLDWRLHTAFGDEQVEPTADDVQEYLEWTVRMQR